MTTTTALDQSHSAVALRVLRIIAHLYDHGQSTIDDLMTAAQCSRATVYRLIQTAHTAYDISIYTSREGVTIFGAGILSMASVRDYVRRRPPES